MTDEHSDFNCKIVDRGDVVSKANSRYRPLCDAVIEMDAGKALLVDCPKGVSARTFRNRVRSNLLYQLSLRKLAQRPSCRLVGSNQVAVWLESKP